MKTIINWFKSSHRGMHLLLGIIVGLLPTDWYNTEILAVGVAGSMEFKDYQWGGKPDFIDFILTVIGVNLGHIIRISVNII